MALIGLRDLAHSYRAAPRPPEQAPGDWALQPLDLSWDDGGAYALLGPSGSGKSTLLNILSGLLTPSRGTLTFDGVDVTRQPAKRRNIAQVFQFPVVYDTMTVAENLAFPLRNRRLDATTIRDRVAKVADILDLTADLPRRASGLTADAKQRISMGRGLVRQDVAAILFDEPLTVIDPHLKWVLRRKLKQVHQELKLTLIYVTHDQTEALTFADRVVVMDQGAVLQQGTPQELFEAPAHAFVGHFIGSPGMNFLGLDPRGVTDDGQSLAPAAFGAGAGGASRPRHPAGVRQSVSRAGRDDGIRHCRGGRASRRPQSGARTVGWRTADRADDPGHGRHAR